MAFPRFPAPIKIAFVWCEIPNIFSIFGQLFVLFILNDSKLSSDINLKYSNFNERLFDKSISLI